MSPLSLRRFRAERLLREEFDRLRAGVLANARARLRASGVRLDQCDLDACYAQAWQGLYAAVLGGERVANPGGWLSVATVRRGIDEHRARERAHCHAVGAGARDRGVAAASEARADREHDLAAELDDRAQLRHLFEGLRCRLSSRELQAAALCYLQGFSRAEAAARMGLSERRMRRLMEGSGERLGVAGKVGALAETIRSGTWCEEQGSLMRALAYGVLDPGGERYRLALIHRSECPACRAYVLSLRGLAAALPPVPALLRWALPACAGGGAGAGVGAHASAGMAGASAAGASAGAGLAPQGPGLAGALSAGGAGAAGGGWLLAGGPVSAKLAVGCLLALGLGAGCVALNADPHQGRGGHRHRELAADRGRLAARLAGSGSGAMQIEAPPRPPAAGTPSPRPTTAGAPAATAARASATTAVAREFGPERPAASSGGEPPAYRARTAQAHTSSLSRPAAPSAPGFEIARSPSGGAASSPARSSGTFSAAQREFAPG